MARAQPLIAVRDVDASARWYGELLGLEGNGETHGGLYERLTRGGQLVLQLHAWDREDHPNLINREKAPVGHGVLLWFEVDDFDDAVARATKLQAEVLVKPHVNEAPMHREIWLRDPDGYVVVVVSPDGEAE
jgi:catechol 2,3-dioxygenase-like lactoylglutathione lyase family enzyme